MNRQAPLLVRPLASASPAARRIGCGRKLTLLASSSCAVLVMASGSAAAVTCYTGPFAFTNNGALSCIAVSNTSFSGNIVNGSSGVISPGNTGGIGVINQSTITGLVSNAGAITVGGDGIHVDTNSIVTNGVVNTGSITAGTRAAGIAVVNSGTIFTGHLTNSGTFTILTGGGASSTFSGGITNSGTITSGPGSIFVSFVDRTSETVNSAFSGGITNAGTISAGIGIQVAATCGCGAIASFAGGITNSGTIIGPGAGISVSGVSLFSGGIANSGSIANGDAGIVVFSTSTFTGGVTNSGTLFGITGINVDTISVFSGGITNSGTITAAGAGIAAFSFSTFSGGITNAGTISASGSNLAGVLVEDFGTFSGGITNSGTIVAGPHTVGIGAFSFGAFNGGIANGGTISAGLTGIEVNSTGSATFAGGITNTGQITGAARGILVAQVAAFTSGITNSGTVAGHVGIEVDAVAGFAGGITNAGLITASNGGAGVFITATSLFAGGITNSGTVTGGVIGISVGSSVATFTGGITNTGMIAGSNNGIAVRATSFEGDIVNTGTINAINAINLTAAGNAITIDQNAGLIAGNILLSSHGDTLNVRGGTINGNIVGQNAHDTINFTPGAGNTFTYGAAYGFSHVSFVNANSGTVVLDGANSAGNIAVNGGVLRVGDAANPGATLTGSVDVIGGTLAGHGTVVGDVTVENGGVVSPGGSIGTLTVNGPLTFNPGSTYQVQIGPGAGNSSTTVVNGTVNLNGNVTVTLVPQLGHYTATGYTILSGSSINGSFAGVNFAAPFTFTGAAALGGTPFNAQSLVLGDGFALFTPGGLNQNQQGVVNGINGSILGGATPPSQFQNLTSLTGGTLLNALSQLSGENSTGFQSGALQAGSSFLGLLLNPYVEGRGDGFTPAIPFAADDRPALPDAALAFAKFVKANPRDATLGSGPQFRVWGAAYGGSGTIDGDAAAGTQKTTASNAAFAAGIDYLLSPNTTVGFALAGGGTSWGLSGGLGDGRSDMFQAGVYARQRFGDAYLSGALAYSFHDVTTTRTVTIAGTDTLQGRFQANGLGARLEGGYHVATPFMPFVRVTPYGAVQVQSLFLPAYGETAVAGSNQFALNFASQTATTTRTEIGSWFDRSFFDRGHLWTLYGRLAWAHDFGNTPSASAIFQALPGSNFVVNGAVPNADSALVTTGVKYDLLNGWSFLAKFDGEFSTNTSIFSGTGIVRKVW